MTVEAPHRRLLALGLVILALGVATPLAGAAPDDGEADAMTDDGSTLEPVLELVGEAEEFADAYVDAVRECVIDPAPDLPCGL